MMDWPSPALALIRVLTLMLVTALVAAPLSATAQAAAFASSSTRSCGFDKKGIGIEVRASKNVSCALARSMMEKAAAWLGAVLPARLHGTPEVHPERIPLLYPKAR
jgi:hypothetical protein